MTLRTIKFDDDIWTVVPRSPTDDMIYAGLECDSPEYVYATMLRAAPEPPAQQPTRDLLAEATEQVEALDRENRRMRRCVATLMARLTVWLDDDQFNEADGIMTPEFDPPVQRPMTDEQVVALATGLGWAVDFGGVGKDAINLVRAYESATHEPPAQPPRPASITLTGAQIRDLADMAGLAPVDLPPESIELETRMTITGPDEIHDEDGNPTRYPLVAYITEYPEEGYIPLGDPLPEARIGKGESNDPA